MIERYRREEMARAWSDGRRLERWVEVELAVVAEREAQGAVPRGTTARLRAAPGPDPARMAAIEAECGHDVIAFLRAWAEAAGPDARHVHAGMTSADLTDTALALQLVEAGALLAGTVRRLRRAAWELAQAHRRTVMAGRTHGMHAEPITFGLKCLTWSEELGRDLARLETALRGCAVGKLSGAVGNLAHVGAATEAAVLARLGLAPEPVASQVVCRDRHAALLATLAVLGGSMERVAVEVRHLQRSEVREAGEPFGERQQGSSAMPHKRNPVRCERVSGLARLLRAHALAALEDQALWHERDISHSSVERVILPDAFLVADFMADELAAVLSGLRVDPAAMRRNLEAGGGLVHSQRVLLALTAAGMAREEAYRLVQGHALAALEGGAPFRAALEADPRVRAALGVEAVGACFDLEAHLRGVDALFARAGEPEA